ncbi:MAG: helix-turn-helix domain-containing protein [Candidatus Zixiibacteriota bacterium]
MKPSAQEGTSGAIAGAILARTRGCYTPAVAFESRISLLSRDGVIGPEHLPQHVVDESAGRVKQRGRLNRSLSEIESEHIHAVLKTHGNNRTRAADVLGISPVTLWRRLKEQ